MQLKRGRSKSEEKRNQIIESAGCLFIEQGFENVSMDNIARKAGVSKQTVYSHFGTKEQLFTTAIECKVEEYQLGEPESDTDADPAQYLREFCAHLSALLNSDDAMGIYRACVGDAGRNDIGNLFWEAGPSKIRRQLMRFLRRQSERGFFDIPDLEIATVQLLSMLHGESHSCALLGNAHKRQIADIEGYGLACAELFLRAYRCPDAAR